MITLAIRSDRPLATVALYDDSRVIGRIDWEAHRALGATLLPQIHAVLEQAGLTMSDIAKIVAYEGPGSFTGLRIGLSVANALGYSLGISVVASGGDDWERRGIGQTAAYPARALPVYGGEILTTAPRK